MFADVVKNEQNHKLQKVASYMIQSFVDEGFTEGIDAHLKFDASTQLWSQNFHLTCLRA